ncbi:hypothetical protein PILCRDRAFT_598983 [Piloderma croceum F 1598]|uniref:Secreted protein n=1 Tax=Piloderma croceum (strain F 1598) TaxID=765440 RepID=A0A0C3FE52_PILCF|nr:hypothetical protein PILCRDRAFT_598983 [Piloderma croceum F 1598]
MRTVHMVMIFGCHLALSLYFLPCSMALTTNTHTLQTYSLLFAIVFSRSYACSPISAMLFSFQAEIKRFGAHFYMPQLML